MAAILSKKISALGDIASVAAWIHPMQNRSAGTLPLCFTHSVEYDNFGWRGYGAKKPSQLLHTELYKLEEVAAGLSSLCRQKMKILMGGDSGQSVSV